MTDLRQIELQEIQNEIKKKMKHALVRVDVRKQGTVSKDVFFQILEVLDVKLPARDKQRCLQRYDNDGLIKYADAIRFLAIDHSQEKWEFRALEQLQDKPFSKESKHRRMKTIQVEDSANWLSLKTAATPKGNDDEKSIAASQLDRVWNDHINTIQFGDYTSKATRPSGPHSRARSKRLNQNNLTALSQSNDAYSQVRNSQPILNEDLVTKSNLFSKDGRNSKKSRVQTAISRNNQISFKDRQNSMVSIDNMSRNKSFYTQTMSNMNETTMLKIVLSKLKSYQVSPQVLNGVRYEMFRYDSARNNLIFGKQFKDIYRNFNIRMTVEDQKFVYEYLKLNAPSQEREKFKKNTLAHGDTTFANETVDEKFAKRGRMMFNLDQLAKIIDSLSKEYLYTLEYKNYHLNDSAYNTIQPDRMRDFMSMSKFPKTSLELLLEQLQQKLRINFGNLQDAFRFFDINATQKCKKEHFVFNCAYFDLNFEFKEVLELFDLLDKKGLGYLDESHFQNIFDGMSDTWNTHNHDITKSILRQKNSAFIPGGEYQSVDIKEAYNTLDKFGPQHEDMHGYPHFFKQVKSRFGKDTLTQASRKKHQRTLSIVDKEGKVVPANQCKKMMKSEYAQHFTAQNSIIHHPDTILARQQSKKRAQTARAQRRQIKPKKNANGEQQEPNAENEPPQTKKLDIWTRDSIVNVNKMKQPETFARLMQGKYMDDHIESQKEKDRIEYLHSKFTDSNPRIFRNFIDTNSNLLRKAIQQKKMQTMKASEENEAEIQESIQKAKPNGDYSYRNYNPAALKLLRPTLSINKLIGQTTQNQGQYHFGGDKSGTIPQSRKDGPFRKTSMSLGLHQNLDNGDKIERGTGIGFYQGTEKGQINMTQAAFAGTSSLEKTIQIKSKLNQKKKKKRKSESQTIEIE